MMLQLPVGLGNCPETPEIQENIMVLEVLASRFLLCPDRVRLAVSSLLPVFMLSIGIKQRISIFPNFLTIALKLHKDNKLTILLLS